MSGCSSSPYTAPSDPTHRCRPIGALLRIRREPCGKAERDQRDPSKRYVIFKGPTESAPDRHHYRQQGMARDPLYEMIRRAVGQQMISQSNTLAYAILQGRMLPGEQCHYF